jgi:hypothetical protein
MCCAARSAVSCIVAGGQRCIIAGYGATFSCISKSLLLPKLLQPNGNGVLGMHH